MVSDLSQRPHLGQSASRRTGVSPVQLLAQLATQAGDLPTDGKQPILDVRPTGLHQRTPLLVGSKAEMELLMGML
jgi:fructose-1,6-bisphosphatase